MHKTTYRNVSERFFSSDGQFLPFGSLNVGSSSFTISTAQSPDMSTLRRVPYMNVKISVVTVVLAIVAGALVSTSSANPEHVATFRATKKCPGCDLKNAQLGGFQAPNADLVNADLSDATFYGGSLKGADLTGAILDRTNFEMADLTGAVGAILGPAITDARTTCPDGTPGPCK
jgi:uncharacterized protein YjbI with pentapeptide repeats